MTNVGDILNTADPVPVSSVRAAKSCAEVNDPKEVTRPDEVIAPVRARVVRAVFHAVSVAITICPTVEALVSFRLPSISNFQAVVSIPTHDR